MTLHVTNGDGAAGTLRQSTLGGSVLAWNDVLHEGPVPAMPRDELLRTRADFLARCSSGDEAEILASLERRDLELLDALDSGDQVVLWFEHDLYDQLQLLDVLTLAHTSTKALELIVVGAFPGKLSFTGLGELTADELETLWPSRVGATPAMLEQASRAWAAFRKTTPAELAEVAKRGSDELPFLGAALRRLLEELPAPIDGLSGTERRALRAVAAGARTPAAAFVAAQRLEAAPFLGDTWFYRTLSALGQSTERLVETHDGGLRLTPTGEQVLNGKADRVQLLAIDRWVGGTHVTTDNVWRWDGFGLV